MVLSGKQPYISVWLAPERDDTIKRFHCPICGKIVFEYYSPIKIMVNGDMGEAKKAPIVVQCHGTISVVKNGQEITTHCKAKYMIE